jgi:nucleoporin GLE1
MSVPRYPARSSFGSDREYFIALGYEPRSDRENGLETTESYLARQGSFVRLYAAIMQTAVDGRSNYVGHPHGIEGAWAWLARVLNRPCKKVTIYCLLSFLETAAFALHRTYGHQFLKMVRYLLDVYGAKIPAGCESAKTQLTIFLEELHKSRGKVKVPEGHGVLLET